jgi:hypothetical protein
MVFNATFINISAILWWSVLLVEETRVPEENNEPISKARTNKLYIFGQCTYIVYLECSNTSLKVKKMCFAVFIYV